MIQKQKTEIDKLAFCWCKSITKIDVDKNNEYFSSDERGVLFNKDKTVIRQYPMANIEREYVIPESVTRIEDRAFAFCENLTCITMHNGVDSIGEYSFHFCSRLSRIMMPNTVKNISEGAFYICSNLKDVCYNGTEAEWNQIVVESRNDELLNATIHYNHGPECEFDTFAGYSDEHPHYELHKCTCGNTKADTTKTDFTEVAIPAVAPTCTMGGWTEGSKCSKCTRVFVAQEFIESLGYKAVLTDSVAPTCTETGLTFGSHCSVCNIVIVEQQVEDARGHAVVVDEAVAPTCTETGLTEGSHCSVCNEVLVEQTVVDAIGHTDGNDDGVCDTCDKILCTCRCHKTGVAKFIWNIRNVFQRIFGNNTACVCGKAH